MSAAVTRTAAQTRPESDGPNGIVLEGIPDDCKITGVSRSGLHQFDQFLPYDGHVISLDGLHFYQEGETF